VVVIVCCFVAYNPNLGEVTRATRQAYVKFMVPKIKKDKDDAPDSVERVRTASELRNTASQKSTVSMTKTLDLETH
jgi:transient receptor potential cation channel subfamily C member 4